ncbi:NADH-quinone oxidoreductase subunit J family protein [Leptospira meyeri]|uniref:NADH-quinone oxidoreductase subunit J family protein n=1 Tax=Leptospira meyeri TaxID=29508 RepID=UPI000C2B3716|nr:NADH-quinone oxidoreductase subunit J [Leptospira meyeri]PKA26713.1 NADH-quinone oxidoreductase subunit C [Leptospira sp. mixed culture ATI2-C-A1]MCW7489670.1 NADH-quinone oxidoreductase subunit J [Leptospira meyeri]PJZ82858.1 NADH-quinone oxidoreductase subunit C [Leptospira meyeri]PJZ97902.1 NADH-quinone oxidoreductase subunit C [Leptospira meyeri]PKA12615.1 NADH-quinone oxidoreductase subunit C [Leptospira meyeri]
MDEIIYMNIESSPSFLLFIFFGTVTVVTALSVIFQKNPVVSAVSLVFTFFSLAGIYGIMGALFIATMQVLVYAGAIMVLIVFVLMLLSQRAETLSRYRKHPIRLVFLSVFALGFFFLLYSALTTGVPHSDQTGKGYELSEYSFPIQGTGNVKTKGNVATVGASTYLDYLLPFEMISILLLVAVLGAVILAKKRLTEVEQTKDNVL